MDKMLILLSSILLTPKGSDKLPYATSALQPYVSEQTIKFHHGKHLAAYLANTKRLQNGTPFESQTLEELVLNSSGSLYNNAAQAYNHIFYFEQLAPAASGKNVPDGAIMSAIEQQFGSFQNFKDRFAQSAMSLFGSGWIWLTMDSSGELRIEQSSNADNPIRNKRVPLFTMDVWEHSYYLDRQNDRASYIEQMWNVINWDVVSQRLEIASKIMSDDITINTHQWENLLNEV